MPYDVFLPEFFKKIIKELKKKYPHVGEDLKTALRVLVNNPELGRTLRGFGDVKKLRVQNSDVERGKSGGYRLTYLVGATCQKIIPLLMYSKSQKRDISRRELKTLLAGLDKDLN